ncbi:MULTISPECIES: tetratricopeptide repeat protein [Acidithiobacillus]|uniref:tetratricopeptide repeat protein n=1 Tax=Acidithiobacillus TaxID=119977 RepID=UPI00094AF36C|nr:MULTISPECIES: tetratricopeptide repeat protein [Acidithiobacillus]MDD5279732.1 tetratricopeptide repeat protein [Acidithiobacillus sp.]
MQARIVIPLVLMGLLSMGNTYALTNMQAKHLVIAAYNGNTTDLAKLESAAKYGDAVAQTWLGRYLVAKKDYAKANSWYEKAVAQGYARAENKLGDAYYYGQGVPQVYAKANSWYKKAAAQGYAVAEFNLGYAYHYGQGVPQDYAKADYWNEKAADQGNAKAENNLGNAYYHGHGVPQDYAKADYWYEKAAAQGNARAENKLGACRTFPLRRIIV